MNELGGKRREFEADRDETAGKHFELTSLGTCASHFIWIKRTEGISTTAIAPPHHIRGPTTFSSCLSVAPFHIALYEPRS